MKKQTKHPDCPDTEGLGYLPGPGRVGCVDEVNGDGARPCPDYVPTRHELMELARYWLAQRLEIALFYFETKSSGSTEYRISLYAQRRLARIADALGDDALDQVQLQVEAEFQKRFGDAWTAFRQAAK